MGCVSVGLCSSIVSVFVSNEWICAWASVRTGEQEKFLRLLVACPLGFKKSG